MYTELIGFPAGEGPFGLSKLVAVFVIAGLRNLDELKFRQTITLDPSPKTASPDTRPFAALKRADANLDEDNFAQILSPAVFEGPCTLIAKLELDIEGEIYPFEYRLRVVRGAPGASSVVSSPSPN